MLRRPRWDEDVPLAERVQRAAFSMVILVVVALGAAFVAFALYSVPKEQTAQNAGEAKAIAEIVGGDIDNMLDGIRGFSRSPLVWTALTDSAGREAYLRPFLNARGAAAGQAMLALHDYRGRAVISAPAAAADGMTVGELVKRTLARDQPTLIVSRGEPLRLLAAFPVVLPSSAETIGVLVGAIDLREMFRRRAAHLSGQTALDLNHGGDAVDSTGPPQESRYFPVYRALPLSEPVEGGGLGVVVALTENPWLRPVGGMTLIALVGALIVGPLAWYVAGVFARRTMARLNRLVAACEAAAPGSLPTIPDDPHRDEIGLLSRTLQNATAAYAKVNDRLALLVDERTRELAASEDRLRGAIDAIDEAFAIFDSEDRLVYYNQKYVETYPSIRDVIRPGATFSEITGTWARRGSADTNGKPIEDWIAERANAHRLGGVLIQRTEAGRWVRIVERKTTAGNIVGFRVDISELMKVKELAEEANLAKSRFLATMSHEIRTPLNGILGMAQLLLHADITKAERDDYVSTILASGRMLLALLNDILDLSKVEAGKLALVVDEFRPQPLLDSVRALFAELSVEKGTELSCAWNGPAECKYVGDVNRLRQMLANLVSNAIKFTTCGSVRIEATELGQGTGSPVLEFSVADTGCGIPENKRSLLFMPFSQIDSSSTREHGGTGLGLSIVRSLAQWMGGEVGVESTEGKGSRFWFRIPVGRGDAAAAVPAGEKSAPSAPDRQCGRILVVEDNPTNRKLVVAVLQRLGFTVEVAEDGSRGLAAVTGGTAFDIVLMDVQMPVMDGCMATGAIREWEARHGRPRTPVIALTAGAFEEDQRRCLDAGMDDFLAKPIDIDRLSQVLAKWLVAAPAAAPETGGQAADGAVFDAADMLARLGHNLPLARTVIESAMRDLPGYLGKLEQAMAAQDWNEARRATHTMKGLLAQIGGARAAQRMKEADQRLFRHEPIGPDTVAALRTEYAELSAVLTEWLARPAQVSAADRHEG